MAPTLARMGGPLEGLKRTRGHQVRVSMSARSLHERPRTPPFPNPCILSYTCWYVVVPQCCRRYVQSRTRMRYRGCSARSTCCPPSVRYSFPVCRHCPPRRSYAAWSPTLHSTHPVRCRLSASCRRPSARRLPACGHASLSALSSLQPRLPQPRRPEPFLPTPPCSLSLVSSPLLSARRLAVCRRSEHSRLAACHRIGDHPSATCTPVDRRRPDSHQRRQRTRPPE
jgi:hypothetical protein